MANDIRFKVRSDTSDAFEANDTLLLQDEIALDRTSKRLKIGDGVTTWNNLPYVKPEIIDNLSTGGSFDALSATQGVVLKNLIDGKADSSTVSALQQTVNNLSSGGSIVSASGVNDNSTAGYIKFTNNWLVEWGRYGPITYNQNTHYAGFLTYPWSFTNECVFAMAQTHVRDTDDNGFRLLTQLDRTTKSSTGCTIISLNALPYSTLAVDKTKLENIYIYLLAIGY